MSAGLPSISGTESQVLDLLQDGELFGLQLVEHSRGTLKRGSVYVILARMEAKGFVTSQLEDRQPNSSGVPRRLYRATPYGLKVRDAYRMLREALDLKPSEARS